MSCIFKNRLNPEIDSQTHKRLSSIMTNQQAADAMYTMMYTDHWKKNEFGIDFVQDWKNREDNSNELIVGVHIYSDGEPMIHTNEFGRHVFKGLKGPIEIDVPFLNMPSAARDAIISMAMFDILSDSIDGNTDVTDGLVAKLKSLKSPSEDNLIYDIFNGNQKEIDAVIDMIQKRLEKMGLRFTQDHTDFIQQQDENLDNDSTVDPNTTENSKSMDFRTSNEKNSKDTATTNIKLFLSLIPDLMMIDGNLQFKEHSVTTDSGETLVYNKFFSADEMWRHFEETLADVPDIYTGELVETDVFTSMIEKMREKFANNHSIQYALNLVEDMVPYKQTQFVHAFAKTRNNFQTSIIKDGKYIIFKSADVNDRRKKLTVEWNNYLSVSPLFNYNVEKGKYEYNNKLAKEIGSKYTTLYQSTLAKGYNYKTQDFEQLKSLLKEAGIVMTSQGLSAYIDSQTGERNADKFRNAVDGLRFLFNTVTKATDKDALTKDGSPVNLLTKFFDKSTQMGASNIVNTLADFEAQYRRDLSENTILGPEGKKYWVYSLPSFLSNKINRMKVSPDTELQPSTGFYTNSKWIATIRKAVADNDVNFLDNLQLTTFSNVREENTIDEGSSNKNIEQADQAIDQINKTLTGQFYTPAPADRSTWYGLQGLPLVNVELNDLGKFNDEVIDTFMDYLFDEYERMQEEFELIKTPEAIEKNKTKLYKDYHYHEVNGKFYYWGVPNRETGKFDYTTDPKTPGAIPVGNAFRSALFPALSPYHSDSKTKTFDIFKSGKITKAYESIRGTQAVRDYVNDSLMDTFVQNFMRLEQLGVIDKETKDVRNIDKDLKQKYLDKYATPELAYRNLIADFTINSMAANVEYSKVFSGDYAYYKNLVDLSKRYPATYTDGNPIVTRKGDKATYKVAVMPNIFRPSAAIQELRETHPEIAKAYASNNLTDAQGWITLDRWKFIMERSNHWNPKFDAAYKRIENGTATAEDYKLAAQPIKGVSFGTSEEGVPTFIKYSAAVLIPTAIKGSKLANLAKDMESQGISEAVVIDGIKVGAKLPSEVVDANGSYVGGIFNTITLRNNEYKIQQDLRPKGVKKTLLGSQLKKTAFGNIQLDTEYADGWTGERVWETFVELHNAKSNRGLKKLEQKAGIKEGKVVDRNKLGRQLLEVLEERGAPENLMEAIRKEYKLDVIANYRQKIQNVVNSLINNATVNIKTNGASYIQMSSWAIDESEAEETGVRWLTEKASLTPPTPYTDENGKQKIKPGQVFVTSEYISRFIPNWKERYDADPEAFKKLIDAEALNIIGYRIPNQGMSSNDSLQIVGILEESFGDTIIPYADITTKTGSDFDIDKMYVMIPNVKAVYKSGTYKTAKEYLKKNGYDKKEILDMYEDYDDVISFDRDWMESLSEDELIAEFTADILFNTNIENNTFAEDYRQEYGIGELQKLEYIKYDYNIPASEQSEKAIENGMMEVIRIRLESAESFEELMQPLDSKKLPKDLDSLHDAPPAEIVSEDEYINDDLGNNFFSPMYQMDKKFDNGIGKSGVSLTANQLVDHTFTQIADVHTDLLIALGVKRKDGNTSFASQKDLYGEERITDVLSWFLSAYVDIAKDPFVSKGNHNEVTSNTAFMLIRAGVPWKVVNRIVGQPAVKILTDITRGRKSRVSDYDNRTTRQAVIETLAEDYGIPLSTLNSDAFKKSLKKPKDILTKIDALPQGERVTMIKKLEADLEANIKSKATSIEKLRKDIQYLDLFIHFQTIGEDFAKTVLASKQDVNGAGKDPISAQVNKNRVLESRELNFYNVEAKFNKSFLGTSYENSVELALSVAKDLFVTSSDNAQETYDIIYKIFDSEANGLLSEDFGFAMEKAYFAYILGNTGFNRTTQEVKDMFYGQNTLFKRLYRDIKGKYADGENALVESLSGTIRDRADFLSINNIRNNSTAATNDITNSWREMLISEDPIIRDFAKDLITYSFYSSGFKTNMNSFYEFIPHQELKNLVEGGISDFQSRVQGNGTVLEGFMDKFFRNNYADTSIVPEMKITFPLGQAIRRPAGITVNNKSGVMTFDSGAQGASKAKAKRPYILVKNISENEFGMVETSTLYKKYAVSGDVNYYIPVPKLGMYAQGNYIYEYNTDIPIDGKSAIPQNNIVRAKDISLQTQTALAELNKLIDSQEAKLANGVSESIPTLPSIDNTNENNSLNKGKDDGTFNKKCD
jgi:hypothetical protein